MLRTCLYTSVFLSLLAFVAMKDPDGRCRKPNQTLQEYFKWTATVDKPIIMAHRMSPLKIGYADNGLETLKYTYGVAPCVIQEMDVRMSKDSVLLMLHDSTLNRTTTGKGNLNHFTLKEIEKYELKDGQGNILKGQHVTHLLDILRFVKQRNMIVALDMKPGTDPERLMKEVRETATLNNIFVICYAIKDAVKLHKKYPSLMMALGFNSWENIKAIEQSGLPYQNLIALTPSKLQEKSFYDKIHSMGIMVSFSAQGGVDTYESARATSAYKAIADIGGDIICTDSLKHVLNVFK